MKLVSLIDRNRGQHVVVSQFDALLAENHVSSHFRKSCTGKPRWRSVEMCTRAILKSGDEQVDRKRRAAKMSRGLGDRDIGISVDHTK